MQGLLTAVLTVAIIATTIVIVGWQTKTGLTHTQLWCRRGKHMAGLHALNFVLLLALFYIRGALITIVPIAVVIAIFVPTAIVLRMKNRDLTEMQLFKKYWPVWIGLVILILAAVAWFMVMIFKDFLYGAAN